MNIFMKNRWPGYLPKVNSVWQWINTAKLNKELNSDVHMTGTEMANLTILAILIICTLLFWI